MVQLEALTEQLNEASWDVGQAKRHREKQEIVEMLRVMYPGVYNRLRNLCQPIHSRCVGVPVCIVCMCFRCQTG